jgi:hypothetical protein
VTQQPPSTEGGSRCSSLTSSEAASTVINVVVVTVHILDRRQPWRGGRTLQLPGGGRGGQWDDKRNRCSHRHRCGRKGKGESSAAGRGGARQVLRRCCVVVVSAVHSRHAVEGGVPQIGVLSTIPGQPAMTKRAADRANNNQPLRVEGGQAAACKKSSG